LACTMAMLHEFEVFAPFPFDRNATPLLPPFRSFFFIYTIFVCGDLFPCIPLTILQILVQMRFLVRVFNGCHVTLAFSPSYVVSSLFPKHPSYMEDIFIACTNICTPVLIRTYASNICTKLGGLHLTFIFLKQFSFPPFFLHITLPSLPSCCHPPEDTIGDDTRPTLIEFPNLMLFLFSPGTFLFFLPGLYS